MSVYLGDISIGNGNYLGNINIIDGNIFVVSGSFEPTTTTTLAPTTTTTTIEPTTTTTLAPTTTTTTVEPTTTTTSTTSTTTTTSTSTTTTLAPTTTTTLAPTYQIDYLLVGGGGAGGKNGGGGFRGTGGGGAGGYISGSLTLSRTINYPITVGAGGIGFTNDTGNNGSSSVALGFTALGGGGGAGQSSNANNGASGGGGASNIGGAGSVRLPGTGTSPQGTNGGAATNPGTNGSGGGGGGARTAGSTPASDTFSGGGLGKLWLNGTTYAAGGNSPGVGAFTQGITNGAPNTGNGGGGVKSEGGIQEVSAGGSGVVIIRYLTGTANATGGVITTDGTYTYHTFTSSSNYIS